MRVLVASLENLLFTCRCGKGTVFLRFFLRCFHLLGTSPSSNYKDTIPRFFGKSFGTIEHLSSRIFRTRWTRRNRNCLLVGLVRMPPRITFTERSINSARLRTVSLDLLCLILCLTLVEHCRVMEIKSKVINREVQDIYRHDNDREIGKENKRFLYPRPDEVFIGRSAVKFNHI